MEVKIKLKIKDIEIELDKSELEELKNILNDLTGRRREYILHPGLYPAYLGPYPRFKDWESGTWELTWVDDTGTIGFT